MLSAGGPWPGRASQRRSGRCSQLSAIGSLQNVATRPLMCEIVCCWPWLKGIAARILSGAPCLVGWTTWLRRTMSSNRLSTLMAAWRAVFKINEIDVLLWLMIPYPKAALWYCFCWSKQPLHGTAWKRGKQETEWWIDLNLCRFASLCEHITHVY